MSLKDATTGDRLGGLGSTQWQQQGATPRQQFGATGQRGPRGSQRLWFVTWLYLSLSGRSQADTPAAWRSELCFAPLVTSLSLSLLFGERNPATTKACVFPALMVTPGFQEFDGIRLPIGFASGVSLAPVSAAVILTEVTSVLAGRWGTEDMCPGKQRLRVRLGGASLPARG